MLTFTQWLKEAHQHHLDKLGKYNKIHPKDLNMSKIFGDKRRIVINLDGNEDPTHQFLRLVKTITNHPLTLDELKKGIISQSIQTQQGTKQRDLAISTFLKKHKRSDLLDMYSQVKDRVKNINNDESYSIVISREPVDLLRMSDHVHANGQQIQSCHSPNNNWFVCAVKEAKTGGAIAYAVKTNDLNDVNIQDKEIFTDIDRKKAGIIPLERVRLRRFTYNDQELLIPELRTYPAINKETYEQTVVPGFRTAVVRWARDAQQATIDSIKQQFPNLEDAFKQFNLRGGAYQDNDANHLWNDFFNTNIYGLKKSIDQIDPEDKEQNHITSEEWETSADEFYQQHNNNWNNSDAIAVIYHAHDVDEGDAYGKWYAKIEWHFTQNDFTKEPAKAEVIRGLTDFVRKAGYNSIDRFSCNINKQNQTYDVTITARIPQAYNQQEGDLHSFQNFLDEIDSLDEDYHEIEVIIKAVIAHNNFMTTQIQQQHTNANLKHFKLELNQKGYGQANYILTTDYFRIGNLTGFPSNHNLISAVSGGMGQEGFAKLHLAWNIINELNLAVPTKGAIPDRQAFFFALTTKNLNQLLINQLPLPNAPVAIKFSYSLPLNGQDKDQIYQIVKKLDDQLNEIIHDVQTWWTKLIPTLQLHNNSY